MLEDATSVLLVRAAISPLGLVEVSGRRSPRERRPRSFPGG